MKEMTSGVTAVLQTSIKHLGGLKASQDLQTARLASDNIGLLGTSDPDQLNFLTSPFSGQRMVQTPGNGVLAFMPPDQTPKVAAPYYPSGTPFVLDRAGSGAIGTSIIRPPAPAGYYTGDTILVQQRVKRYYFGDEVYGNSRFIYDVATRPEPKGYILKVDERLDGNFFPGSSHFGVSYPVGNIFPAQGSNLLYSGDPYEPGGGGWDGTVYTVSAGAHLPPVIFSITPNTLALPEDTTGPHLEIVITGENFTNCGFVLIGPYKPVALPTIIFPPGPASTTLEPPDDPTIYGAYFYRSVNIDGTEITIYAPFNMVAGSYSIMVIGEDGRLGILDNGFTVIPEA